MKPLALFTSAFLTAGAFGADTDGVNEHTKRIHESALVLSEIMGAKDRSIPRGLLEKADCVGIVPSLKRAGLIVGAKYGKGVATCRVNNTAGWSAPSQFALKAATSASRSALVKPT